jgi:hypothetical protein
MFGAISRFPTAIADENDVEKAKRFQFLINKIRYERERIDFGVVRGKGERTFIRETDGKTVSSTGQVEYFIAFDFLEDKQRVDRYELHFKEDGSCSRHLGQYIETNDTIEYCAYPMDYPLLGIVFVARPKEGNYVFPHKDFCHPLDIRIIGMLDLRHFTHGNSMSFDALLNSFKQRVPEVLVEEENGVVRFEYHQQVEDRGELNKSVFWIDTKNGFTCLRYLKVREFDSRKDQPWILDDVRVSWKRRDGIWVPVEITFEDNVPVEKKETMVMTLDWENVNRQVDKKYFTYSDFSTSEYTPVAPVPVR